MTDFLDRSAAERWIGAAVSSSGLPGSIRSIDIGKERPWATVLRVDLGERTVWFKACRPVQAFEPRLTAELASRWPDRMAHVLAVDESRAWLLTADAGVSIGTIGNPPEVWLRALPRYAELQRGEVEHITDHLEHAVPDLRLARLPAEYDRLLAGELPLEPDEVRRLRGFAPRFAVLCAELSGAGIGDSVQHDDLHVNGLFLRGAELRFLDWGDASIGHPFFSLVVTFRFLEGYNGLEPTDPWFARLRDAYLEPWGPNLVEPFGVAWRVGLMAHAFAWRRHRDAMPAAARPWFDVEFADLLRWIIARALGEP